MDMRQLETAVAVARYRSFTRAAEALAIGQPAVSRQLRELEDELGVRLFERTTRRVSPTAAGTVFVDRAQQFLEARESLWRDMQEFSASPRHLVRLGAWFSVNPWLPGMLAAFVKANPDIDITIREANSPEMFEMLRARELDVAIATMNPDFDLHDLDHRVYIKEPFLLITPPEWPFTQRSSATFQDIADVPLIMHKPGSAIRRLIDNSFAASARTPRVIVETNETVSARRLVANGIGAAIVPRSIALGPGPKVRVVRLAPSPTRLSVLAWRRDLVDQAVRSFVRHALAHRRNRASRGESRASGDADTASRRGRRGMSPANS